jgi:fatty acid kinase fatty acid binding subunit
VIRIVTDTTCDLPEDLLKQHRIAVVPINIQFGQETFEEGISLTREEFYRKVEELNQVPMTSQPSLGQYMAAYTALASEPDTEAILSVHITSHLSGTFDAALLAASQMPPDCPPITAFDSLSGSMGLGFMVLEAAQMAEVGASTESILARLEVLRERMRIYFSLYDLRFARMSGRVGMARALLASVLDIKMLLSVEEGRLALLKRVRSQAQALRMLVDTFVQEMSGLPAEAAVIHAEAPQAAEQVRAALAGRLNSTRIFVQDLSLGVAVHFGPGTVGVVGYNPQLPRGA